MNTFAADFDARTRAYSRRNAYWLGRAAQLAYDDPAKYGPELTKWGLTEQKFLNQQGTQGFFAGNDDVLLLAFRGTELKVLDFLTDADIQLVGGPGGRVHEGFFAALNWVWRDLWQWLSVNRRGRSLFITGHSLGAALACLATAKLRLERDEPVNGLYTFGQPRTGDRDFARSFDADFAEQTFRYVNNNDVVTRVPFRTMDYSHVGTFRYFDADGHQNDTMSWWDKLVDRVKGRIEDLFKPGTDGLHDHAIKGYVTNLEKNYAS